MYHVFQVVDEGVEAFHLGKAKTQEELNVILKNANSSLTKSYSGRDKVNLS